MGKMNRLNTRLSNGDEGRDCEVESWCGAPAYQLSSTEKLINTPVISNGVARYERTIRYKCGNGHRFDKTHNFDKNLLSPPSADGESE